MSNLVSSSRKWLTTSAKRLVKANRTNQTDYRGQALRVLKALQPLLYSCGHVYLSEQGDIAVFLYAQFDKARETSAAAIVTLDEKGAPKSLDSVRGLDETADLLAAFMCDFPQAIFTIDSDGQGPAGQTAQSTQRVPIFMQIVDTQEHQFATLQNITHATAQGHTRFTWAIPHPSQADSGQADPTKP